MPVQAGVGRKHVIGNRSIVRRMVEKRAPDAMPQGRSVSTCARSAESLPFADDTFDKALASTPFRSWPDAAAGLRAIQRVL